jgi:hypothetical protein
MNASQARAARLFTNHVQRNVDPHPERGDAAFFSVETTSYGTLWIKGETEMTGLGEGNLLRAVSREYWLVSIGKRGGLTVKMAPKPYQQFSGKRAFGMTFDLR